MVRMSKEALRIYNAQSLKIGRPQLSDDSNDVGTFKEQTSEVIPYITGLQTTTDDPDYAKNIKQELDWISNSTHYLFDAVDVAQDAYTQAQDAASKAKDSYDAATNAQDTANQAVLDFEDQQEQLNKQQEQINANTQTGIDNAAAAQASKDAADAAQKAADTAQDAADANSNAITALQQAAATSSATIASNITYGTFDHTITVKDNKDVARTITLLPVIVSATADNDDEADLSCYIWIRGSQIYGESVTVGAGGSSTLSGSWSGTLNPGDGDLSIRVQMNVGGNLYHNISSISGMTVLATQHQENDFVIA